jgi:hypothetical protein
LATAPSDKQTSDRGRGFPIGGAGDGPSKLLVIKDALRTQLPLPNRQSVIPAQDMLRGPVHLDHSAVAIADDQSRGDLIDGAQRSGRFPTQLAKLGVQPGRIAERIEQLLKLSGTNCIKRFLIDSPMNAEDNSV